MDIPELIRISPEQTELINKTANMIGLSFLEEGWTQAWLSALDGIGVSPERKLEISQAIIRYNFIIGTPYSCAYTLPDGRAAAGVYRLRDLQGRLWNDLEDESSELMMSEVLSAEERRVLSKQAEAIASISNFRWMTEDTGTDDYIHFFAIGVHPDSRGSGAFRRLMDPILNYADAHALTSYLECYSMKTEAIYSHYGFEIVQEFRDERFETFERCMRRPPSNVGLC